MREVEANITELEARDVVVECDTTTKKVKAN